MELNLQKLNFVVNTIIKFEYIFALIIRIIIAIQRQEFKQKTHKNNNK